MESIKTASDPKVFQQSDVPAALLLEGTFTSLYANRINKSTADSLDAYYHQPFLTSAVKPSRVLICADGDVAMNEVGERGPLPLGFSKDINYTFSNADFISNCIEYCVNPSGILAARSKDFALRLLDPEKTEDERGFWQLVNIGIPLAVVLICGLIFQWIRKRKYQSGTF